jgi:hypothetical protein
LLPVLDDLAAWFSSPPGQQQLQDIADAAKEVLTNLADTAKWAIANKDWLLPLVGSVTALSAAAKTVALITTAITAARAAMLLFNTATLANPLVLAGVAIIGTGAYIAGINSESVTKETDKILQGKDPMIPGIGSGPGATPLKTGSSSPRVAERAPVNITINTPKVTAQEITNLVNKAQKTGYTGTLRSIKE